MPPAQGIGGAMPAAPGTTAAASATVLAAVPPPLTTLHNASHRHPVFFTTKLRRPAFALQQTSSPSSPSPRLSPVAHGYLYRDARRPDEKAAGPRL